MSAYNECKFKKDRIALLREKLGTNKAWAMKGCSRIFEYQTADEQNSDDTREDNGVGFSGADAYILSRFAKSIDAGKFVGSPKQMAILFKKMPKYARQLDGIAQAKLESAQSDINEAVEQAVKAIRNPNEEDPNRGNKS